MQLKSLILLVPTVSASALAFANPVAFAEALALEHGSEYAQTMGEIAMLYPPDRQWSEAAETIAPCGSYSSSGNRSEFPLDDGFVALVAKSHQAWSVNLKISYNDNPTSNDEFTQFASGNVTNEIDVGHTCFYLPDQPSKINSGDYATIQLEYMAIEDEQNVTHYACADVEFVEESVFKVSTYALSCFNATDNDYYSYSDYGEDIATTTAKTISSTTATATATTSSSSASSSSSSSSKSSGAAAKALNTPATFGFGAILVSLISFFT